MKDKILDWMLDGEVGISSEAIARRMLGRPRERWSDHPHDAHDFRRCVLFLRRVPEARGRLSEMAGSSPEWSALVDNWGMIEELLVMELGADLNGSEAPRTYAMIRRLLDGALCA